MEKAKVAIIAKAGLETILEGATQTRIGTPYGPSPTITIGRIGGTDVAFLPRQEGTLDVPPHKVNYRANIWALHRLGVERILATDAVRGINPKLAVGAFIVPHDMVDFTKQRITTFYDEAPVIQIDVSSPYCLELRKFLLGAARKVDKKVWSKAVYVCTEGPRHNTLAELRMYRKLGCDIVGLTGIPEAFLSRELGMCYAAICSLITPAAGTRQKLSAEEVSRVTIKSMEKLQRILEGTIKKIPERGRCRCLKVLGETQI